MPAAPDRLQRQLDGRYRIERELGRGGMATVYLATDLKHRRDVANKVLDPELAAAIGPDLAEARAKILAQAGDVNAALDEIERLLSHPAFFSVQSLKLDPRWDPIREQPLFKALRERYGAK